MYLNYNNVSSVSILTDTNLTDGSTTTGIDVFATATATATYVFESIPSSTDADVSSMSTETHTYASSMSTCDVINDISISLRPGIITISS